MAAIFGPRANLVTNASLLALAALVLFAAFLTGDMPLTRRAADLTMRWCVDCHRNPAPSLRPRDKVFDPHWRRTADTPSGAQLMAGYRIHTDTLSDCTVCHR